MRAVVCLPNSLAQKYDVTHTHSLGFFVGGGLKSDEHDRRGENQVAGVLPSAVQRRPNDRYAQTKCPLPDMCANMTTVVIQIQGVWLYQKVVTSTNGRHKGGILIANRHKVYVGVVWP